MWIKNKYQKKYFEIINAAKRRTTVMSNFENHHIIPKSFFESYMTNPKSTELILNLDYSYQKNLVKLSLEEHAKCHLLLPYFTTGVFHKKMMAAVKRFKIGDGEIIDGREYEKLKIASKEIVSKMEKVKCEFCYKKFKPGHSMSYHLNYCKENPKYIAKYEKCKFCNNKVEKSALKKHERSCHKNSNQIKIMTACQFCKRKIDKSQLTNHENKCKENKNIIREFDRCQFCHKEFMKTIALTTHENTCNQNPNYTREFKSCKFCDRQIQQSKITAHQNKCNANPDYKPIFKECKYCGERYKAKIGLATHENACKMKGKNK